MRGAVFAVAILCCAGAQATDHVRCVPEVYQRVGAEQNVPASILYAVALAESGKRLSTGSVRPYHWTVVTRGAPQRYASKVAAVDAVRAALASGITNIDVGLMQVNLHWHGYRFGSLESAFDPVANVRAGASILRSEFDNPTCKNDWWCAVRRYHSYRQSLGEGYAERVRNELAGVVCGVPG